MEKLIKLLDGGPVLNLIFLIIAILALFLTLIFYLKGKREKRLVYLYKHSPLIKNSLSSIEGLNILYNGVDIETLTLTRLSIWNAGKETIYSSDIAKSDRLIAKFTEDGTIYSASIAKVKKDTNELSIGLENYKINIDFDYLDHGDGLVIDIYHSHKLSKSITVSGTIKGGEKITYAGRDQFKLYDSVFSFLFPSYWNRKFNEFGFIDKLFIVISVPLVYVLFSVLMAAEGVIRGFGIKKPPIYVEDETRKNQKDQTR